MYQLKVNDQYDFEFERSADNLLLNKTTVHADIRHIGGSIYHIIEGNQSYNLDVVSFNRAQKTAEIKVNANTYTITAKDQFDVLLDKLGLSNLNNTRISEIKAPMPGMVLKVFVIEGQEVKKGDNLFVLEAMKMENIIKSPADVVIKNIKIKAGEKVEKGQILMMF
ncbi:acetyl-CoA carboxylase biotin carboxyl carrier protein subunit [Mucilaginibacter dorajii]|uniref:Acetyl-CoA carboxylase biotin carboxyl carrier protein subunit n=1 Tax=Mucilaginibacter dorajii TaxID=692994 RepID=A0ABP7PDQ8_9SPHI|nr:acetyl-CoA carboxylase biotin carboxyl carrier protein subunit [Mucilaginibacter dorajii]MCS3734646.1 biotin carboxyl carrier protein [Mucilaginibacter dorajii]